MSPSRSVNEPAVKLDRDAALAAISAASLDAVIAVDSKGTIIRWNSLAEQIFGWTREEAVGRTVHETIIPERDRQAHVKGLARYASGVASNIFGTRFLRTALRADGEEIPIELSIMCIRGVGGDLLVCFIRDLSKQERDKRALEELQLKLLHLSRISAMNTMATTLAHELNQPLAAATNYLGAAAMLLERGDALSLSEAKIGIAHSQAAMRRAAETIKSVREMVEKKPLRLKPEKLRPLVADAVRLLGSNMCVQPEIEIPEEANCVLTGKVQLEQVLINLLRNASDAVSQSATPRIGVTAALAGDEVEVCVSDSGPGLPSERVEELFSPFNSTKPDGLGMGLSICRTLIEQNHGRIWAHSSDAGTELHFSIPAVRLGMRSD